jgi:hypothetical protein
VVLHARRANPTVPILARVAREAFDEPIRQAGATAIVAPERAGALMLLEEGARVLGLPAELLVGGLLVPGLNDGTHRPGDPSVAPAPIDRPAT